MKKKIISTVLAFTMTLGTFMAVPTIEGQNNSWGITASAEENLGIKITYSGVSLDLTWNEYSGAEFYAAKAYQAGQSIGGGQSLLGYNKVVYVSTKIKEDKDYTVYYSDNKNSFTQKVTATSSLSASLETAGSVIGQGIFVSVTAHDKNGKIIAQQIIKDVDYNKLDKTTYTDTSLSIPSNIKAIAGDGQVTLTWTGVSGADKYAVRVRETGTEGFTEFAQVTSTCCTVTGLTNGKTYDFLIGAVGLGNYGSAFDVTLPKSATTTKVTEETKTTAPSKLDAPVGFKVTKTTDKVTIKWDAVDGADAYKVYMLNAKTGKYEAYKTVSKTTCTISGLKKGTQYKFKVVALNNVNGKYVAGTTSKVVSTTTKSK